MKKKLVVNFGYVKNNMGDMLNFIIPKDIFGVEIEHTNSIYEAESTGIGSYLGAYFSSKKEINNISNNLRKIKHFKNRNNIVRIWSTGFISYPTGDEYEMRKGKYIISSVRGELSKKRIEKIQGKKLDITTGDAGLLASELIQKTDKKYNVGIIPHFREKDDNIFSIAADNYKNSKIIDLGADPYEVIREISQCETIISSSLHGLIVADSFGIPNIRVERTDKLKGDGFKFDDYYSSFDVESNNIKLETIKDLPSIYEITDNYKITSKMVDKKKQEIVTSFSKYI